MLLDHKMHLLNLTHIATLHSKINAPMEIPSKTVGACPAPSHVLVTPVKEETSLATTVAEGEHMAMHRQNYL